MNEIASVPPLLADRSPAVTCFFYLAAPQHIEFIIRPSEKLYFMFWASIWLTSWSVDSVSHAALVNNVKVTLLLSAAQKRTTKSVLGVWGFPLLCALTQTPRLVKTWNHAQQAGSFSATQKRHCQVWITTCLTGMSRMDMWCFKMNWHRWKECMFSTKVRD